MRAVSSRGPAVSWVVLALRPPGPGPSARAGSWREGVRAGHSEGDLHVQVLARLPGGCLMWRRLPLTHHVQPLCWCEPLPRARCARCPHAPSLRLRAPAQARGLAVHMPISHGAVVGRAGISLPLVLLPAGRRRCCPLPPRAAACQAPGWRRVFRNQTWVLGTCARQTRPPPVGLEGGSHQRPGRCRTAGITGIVGLSAALPRGL